MPDWAGGAVVHPRSDSSDADDYVDMKSFAGKENFGKLGLLMSVQ